MSNKKGTSNMDKIVIAEEMHLEKEWFEDAKKQTIETLPDFMNHVLNDYDHDYGTIVHAVSACAIASAYAANHSENGGITCFQAGCVMWDFIKQWMFSDNKCGLRIIDYDDMLYPQYNNKFCKKTIPSYAWKSLQKRANEFLEETNNGEVAADEVIKHWQSIVDGKVPFGYTVEED